jgi:hypothetical protein
LAVRQRRRAVDLTAQVLACLPVSRRTGFRASAASGGVQLVLVPLVDSIAAVASSIGGEVTDADSDRDDSDPQGVSSEANQPEDQCAVKTINITLLRLVRSPSSSAMRCISRRPSGVCPGAERW